MATYLVRVKQAKMKRAFAVGRGIIYVWSEESVQRY